MRKFISFILLTILLLSGCSKGFDDKLRGKWQLRSYSDADTSRSYDKVFYNLSKNVLWIQTPEVQMMGQFFQKGDSLLLEFPDNETIPEVMKDFGWTSTREMVQIRDVSRRKLELSQGNKYWIFRKF
ncbi:MAG: lipocalin-like domain-containing protein [Bacteroidales bacterium]